MTRDITRKILKDKLPYIAEMELTLFENCDQNCNFCGHEKLSVVGLKKSDIFSKITQMKEFLVRMDKNVDFLQINLVGGELLQDRLIHQGYLDTYYQLIKIFNEYCKAIDVKLEVVIVSGMLFTNRHPVADLLKKLNTRGIKTSLIASYDLSGRIINEDYKENIEFFKSTISSVNTVATNQFIRILMEKKEFWRVEYFNYLYDNFMVYIDTFIPDAGSEYLIPSDEELLEFNKFLYKNYSKAEPLAGSLKAVLSDTNTPVPMSCMSLNKVTIFPDGQTSNCRWRRYKDEHFRNKLNYDDNSNMMLDFVKEHECLSCDYYKVCPLRCYTQWSWVDREKSEGCINKRLFNWVKRENKLKDLVAMTSSVT